MRVVPIALIVLCASCGRSPAHVKSATNPRASRLLEVSGVYHFPPGSYLGLAVREAPDGRVEAYTYDLRDPSKRDALAADPALGRFIDRVDSLIVHRQPSDTNQTPSPNQPQICGDGVAYGARLTIGAEVRTVGAKTCGDRSPGFAGRFAVLQGIVDSLRRLTRPR